MIVTFFGHKNCPHSVQNDIENTIRDLIENREAIVFYVGNQGNFDLYVNKALVKLSSQYSQIKNYIVLAYMPQKGDDYTKDYNTILPEEVAKAHPKYAISKRNDWMLKQSDIVVTYIKRSYGGAVKYYDKAIRQNKCVINIADPNSKNS